VLGQGAQGEFLQSINGSGGCWGLTQRIPGLRLASCEQKASLLAHQNLLPNQICFSTLEKANDSRTSFWSKEKDLLGKPENQRWESIAKRDHLVTQVYKRAFIGRGRRRKEVIGRKELMSGNF
jgi:hypothetical protein